MAPVSPVEDRERALAMHGGILYAGRVMNIFLHICIDTIYELRKRTAKLLGLNTTRIKRMTDVSSLYGTVSGVDVVKTHSRSLSPEETVCLLVLQGARSCHAWFVVGKIYR